MLKLFHGDDLIGTITNETPDELAMVGDIQLTAKAAQFKEVFAFFNDAEKRMTEDPPFADHLLENWSVEDADGKRSWIAAPAINEKNEIWWR